MNKKTNTNTLAFFSWSKELAKRTDRLAFSSLLLLCFFVGSTHAASPVSSPVDMSAIDMPPAFYSKKGTKTRTPISLEMKTIQVQGDHPVGNRGPALSNAKVCFTCHGVDIFKIGPSYKSIAARYKGSNDVITISRLTQKVLYGGAGNWGVVPMVQNHHRVTVEEARELVEWILSMEK